MSPLIYDGIENPVEIAPGRGDLRFSSVPVGGDMINRRATTLVGGRVVSFAMLFATQPWVASAVMRMLWWSVRVPLKAYRRTGDDSRERLRPGDHPVASAIHTPWPGGSQAGLTQAMLGPVLVHGNAINEMDQGARNRIQFEPIDWRFSTPIMPFRDSVSGWKINQGIDLGDRVVPKDQVLHTHWWSPLGPLGVSPLQQLDVTIGIEDAAQRYQRSLFKNGGTPPSAIETSEEFLKKGTPEQRQQMLANLRADVEELHVDLENAGRPAILPPGLTWNAVGQTAVEAALIDQRHVAREEICGVYLIPPPLLGILNRATFSNISVQREMAYTDCLGPPLVMIEQAINAQLITAQLREDDVYVEYDFSGVLRGDRLKEVQAIREAVATGVMTPNEGRTVLNLPKSQQDGMDDFYLSMNNLGAVGATDAGDTALDESGGAETDDSSVSDDELAPVGA